MKGRFHYIKTDLALLDWFVLDWLAIEASELLAKHAEFLRRHGN